MKNRLLQGALLFLITSILLGCNVDASEGIFTRISKSEPVEDVGAVTLIVKDGNVYYALTSQKGLQKYDANQKKWSSIGETTLVRPVSTDEEYIYYAQQGTANTLYKYKIPGEGEAGNITSVPLPAGYSVIAMSPSFDLMLVKAPDKSYAVCDVSNVISDPIIPIIGNLQFSDSPQLIVQDLTYFIVSGKNDEGNYTHILYNRSTENKIELDGYDALFDQPIVAFHYNGTELVAVSSDGTVWEGNPNTALITQGSVSLPDRDPDYLPYPVVHHVDKLYLQEANQKFVTISTAGENLGLVANATENFADHLTTVKIFSFLVGGANIVYAGTTENGIYEINFTTGLAARL